jgi:hypothetical protein
VQLLLMLAGACKFEQHMMLSHPTASRTQATALHSIWSNLMPVITAHSFNTAEYFCSSTDAGLRLLILAGSEGKRIEHSNPGRTAH